MGKSHIKRIAAPKSWPIKRKISKWITRPTPGPHKLESSMPLGVWLKEILKLANTTKETKYILNNGQVLVNGKARKDQKFPVGIMDVLTAGKENYRIMLNTRGKLVPVPINATEAKIYPKRVIGKTSLKGKKTQVNLSDGTNILSENKYKTGDTVVFSEGKIKDHLKFEKGVIVYILAGKQVGKIGVVKEIVEYKDFRPTKIIFTQGKEDFETLKEYAFVIGKTKPIVSLPNE